MRYICTGGGRCVLGWCLDSPCGGSITGSLVWYLSLCSRSSYQRWAILPVDLCVDVVHWLSLCGEIKSVYLHVVQLRGICQKSNNNSSIKSINHISHLLKVVLYWLFYFNFSQLRTLTGVQFIRQFFLKETAYTCR